MAILEISTGKLTFANAGHTAPLIYKDKKIEYLKTSPDLMLAAMEGMPYENHEITLSDCDRLFVYTDGVTEATNGNEELYGEERLLKRLKLDTTKVLSPKEIIDFVHADIEEFVGGASQFDDITMLEMLYKPTNSGGKK
jgi:sigma-B regulation protein RsbU (phosphoserine phosphatase)